MYGPPNSRADYAERLANATPRFPLPHCDIETGAEYCVTARIILDEFETSFGICHALVTIEGHPEDWSIASIEMPTGVDEFNLYCKTKRHDSSHWMDVTAGSYVEREIHRAVRQAITEDMATDALRAEMEC